jgi:hypothetical protein
MKDCGYREKRWSTFSLCTIYLATSSQKKKNVDVFFGNISQLFDYLMSFNGI